ncbi:MAG: hypothetical protein ABSC23_13185 [Bryobacteraceae bacterium]|jgi:hypothetical protein
MIIVRNCFIAKPGQASKLAAQLSEAAKEMKLPGSRVLTDITGDFNRVVFEYEAASAAEFETRLQDYATNKTIREKMAGYTELWLTGSRELLRIWG